MFTSTNQPANPGRKKKPHNFVVMAENRIRDRLPEVVDALLDAGLGVMVQETDEHGKTRIYQRPPDTKALIHLLDRAIGKVPQVIEGDMQHTLHADQLIRALLSGREPQMLEARIVEEENED